MPSYKVLLTSSAEKELRKLPNHVIKRIAALLDSLTKNPRPQGCRKLQGSKNDWRVRTGDYRIIYSIEDKKLIVKVIRIAHRKDVYNA